MEENIRVPPAIDDRFEKEASNVCERAEIDYHELFLTKEELLFCLRERWRNGIGMGLSDEDALGRALESFQNPAVVAKSLRKPGWVRLLTSKRYIRERLGMFFLGYFAYTCLVIYDTHWKSLYLNSEPIPVQIFYSSGFGVLRDGLGIMLICFLALVSILILQWRPHMKQGWVSQLLSLRPLFLLVAGYALFSLTIHSAYLCSTTMRHLMKEYSGYHESIVRYCLINFAGVVFGWVGAICLLAEMFECDCCQRMYHFLRLHLRCQKF